MVSPRLAFLRLHGRLHRVRTHLTPCSSLLKRRDRESHLQLLWDCPPRSGTGRALLCTLLLCHLRGRSWEFFQNVYTLPL